MHALVVGGAGYIGSHTCKALKQGGFIPVVYDNLQTGHAWAVKYGPLVVGDLLDQKLLDQTLEKYRPEVVFHFASSIDARASMQNPSLYYKNNLVGSFALVDAMQRHGVSKLVFSSTAAVYGVPQGKTLAESHPCSPVNVYGKTKWMVEEMIHDFEKAYGLQCVILRYFNAAGADPDGELGEAHIPETHLIPLALNVACEKASHLSVFGDGSAVRDYIHVADLATAHVKAARWLLQGKGPKTFNLGTGAGHSLSQVLEMVEKITQKPVPRKEGPANPNEPAHLVADVALAQSLLGWRPVCSDLATIVATAYDWHQKR